MEGGVTHLMVASLGAAALCVVGLMRIIDGSVW